MESGFEPARTIYLSFGHDEEIGGVNGAAEVANTCLNPMYSSNGL